MNAVQVGIDLRTKELHWTSNFDSFCKTRQLEIVQMHTPLHSLIRYFRKRGELEGVYGNDKRMIEMVGSAYHLLKAVAEKHSISIHKSSDLQWRFGKIYTEKLDKVKNSICPHFDIHTEEINGYPTTTLVPNFDIADDLRALKSGAIKVLPQITRGLREKHGKGMEERLRHLLDINTDSDTHLKKMWYLRGDAFIKGNVTAKEMQRIDKVIEEHRPIEHHFLQLTLAEQMEHFKILEQEVRKRGKWVYGALENRRSIDIKTELSSFLDEQEEILKRTLTIRRLAPIKLGEYSLKELVTGAELLNEGMELHHCVGGYAASVEKQDSIIVSIREGNHAKNWSTLELRKSGFIWTVSQHRGLLNQALSNEIEYLGHTYCAYINVSLILGGVLTQYMQKAFPRFTYHLGNVIVNVCSVVALTNMRYKYFSLLSKVNESLAKLLGLPEHIYTKTGFVSPTYRRVDYWKIGLGSFFLSEEARMKLKMESFRYKGCDNIPF